MKHYCNITTIQLKLKDAILISSCVSMKEKIERKYIKLRKSKIRNGEFFLKKTLIVVGTVLTVTLSGLGYSAPTIEAAQSVSENNEKISKVENKIINSSKKVNGINLDIDILENALEENNKEVKKVTKEVKNFETDIKKTESEIDVLEVEIADRNEILKERLSSYQNDGGEVSFMEVIFGSADFEEFISRYTAVTTITNADNKLVEIQKEAMAEVETKQKEVEEKLVKTKDTKAELEKVNKVKKDQKVDLTNSKKEVEKEVAKLKDQKAEYVAEGHNLAALEARVEEEVKTNNLTEQIAQTATQTTSETEATTESPAPETAKTETSATTETASTESSEELTEPTSDSKKKEKSKPKADLGSGSNGSALSAAHSQTGTRYATAGKNPSSGFDCSGFVSWAYGQEGVSLPSYTGALAGKGQSVPSLSQAKPGDLVFFRGGAHVGIYAGGGNFIGSQTSTGVAVASMTSGYWKDNFDGKIRRVK